MHKRMIAAFLAVLFIISAASAQKAEVTISLNEAFFDALLESVFHNFDPPEFPIAGLQSAPGKPLGGRVSAFAETSHFGGKAQFCAESVKILREMNGVRTAVRFREGKIFVPLAFSGNYEPPFIGCVEFAGWAEANLDLEFDQNAQKLFGRARILNVNLNGTGGVGGTVIARMIQRSIDKKLNPIEILSLDKVSFGFPVQKSGTLRMKALKIRPEVSNGLLNIRVDYQFLKG
jgi:hypothetical protein